MIVQKPDKLPLSDEVVFPAFRANGEWPQINGPEQVAMAASAADLVESGQLSWDAFFKMDGITTGQFVRIGKMVDGRHDSYKIDAHVFRIGKTDNERIISMNRLGELASGWRKGIWDARKAVMGSAYTLDGIPPIGTDRELLYTQKVHALSLMWQTAGVVLDRPDIKNASVDYRERLSQIYNDPFASTRERQQFSSQTNGIIRGEITGVVLDARLSIGDISGYTPHEQTVNTWSESVFYY